MTELNFDLKEVIAIGASLLSIGSMVYTGYLKGRLKSLEPLINVSNRYQQLIIIVVMVPYLKDYQYKRKGQRTFVTYSTGEKKFRIGVAHRVKVKRYGFSFDLERSFQFHFHFGKISVFILFNPFIIFENVKDWYGKDVRKQE